MTRHETPAFDPAIAYYWTLRSAEIARRRQRPRDLQADRKKFESPEPEAAQVNGNDMHPRHAVRYEAPAFEPGIAFSWTLRSADIARRQSLQRLDSQLDVKHLNVLVAA